MVYVFFAEGFEEIEALAVVDILRRAEIRTHMIGVTGKSVTGAHDITVQMDNTIKEITHLSDVSMLVLPGGMPGTKHLMESGPLKNLLNEAYNSDLYIAAICAAPMVLSEHDLIKGRKITCYPGIEKELKHFVHSEELVVQDGKLITAKGPGAAIAFGLKLTEILKGNKVSEAVKRSLILPIEG